MKITETVLDTRRNETFEVSWGDRIPTDLDVITTVALILTHQRDRDAGSVHSFQGRLDTLAITIEL